VKYEPQLHVVLHQPEIPQNTGNIGRTCVALAAKLWLIRPLGFRVDQKQLRRAGLDYWEHLEWEVLDDWETFHGRLPDARRWFLSKTATRVYTTADFQRGDVLVFGKETEGLPQSILAGAGDFALRIPIREQVRSLNLANSVAIVAYEAARQLSLLK
jgi:tRNA (cytidine/uridine-2'-O-)-methyltransferase